MAEYSLGMAALGTEVDLDGLREGLDEGRQVAEQGGSAIGAALGGAINAAMIGIGATVVAALGGIVKGVQSNMQFEAFEAQFASLLGDTQAAKDKIEELADFAATTPFELPGVIQASKMLLTFGGTALNTADNMQIVGNAAAAMGQPIDQVAFWFGRAYSAINAGQPFGEAAAELQNMGILSGDARLYLEELQKTGASNAEVWTAFQENLQAPTDAMDKLGKTAQGLQSTFSDTLDAALRTIGAPFFDLYKEGLGKAIEILGSDAAQAAFERLADQIRTGMAYISEFFQAAYDWGSGFVDAFVSGIASNYTAVVDTLGELGSIITSWLEPHSPPKLLPELDQWGADAASVYMQGWTKGDFSAFRELSGTIRTALENIVTAGGMGQQDLIPTLLGSREVIAEIINQVRTVGSVSEEWFTRAREAAGPAADQVEQLARQYVAVEEAGLAVADAQREVEAASQNVTAAQEDLERATQGVTAAQQELNDVTAIYDEQLGAVDEQIGEVDKRLKDLRDAKRAAALQKTIDDKDASAEDKEAARLELQRMELEKLRDAKEDEKEAAVDAAKEKIDAAKAEEQAAKDRVEMAKEEEQAAKDKLQAAKEAQRMAQAQLSATNDLINAQKEQNALLREQTKLVEDTNKPKGGGGKGAPKAPAPPPMKPSAPTGGPAAIIEDVKNKSDEAKLAAQNYFSSLADNAQGVLDVLTRFSPTFAIIRGALEAAITPLSSIFQSVLSIISGFIQTNGQDIVSWVQTTWGQVQGIVNALIPPIQQVIQTVFGAIASFLQTNGADIQAFLATAWQTISEIITLALGIIERTIIPMFQRVASFIGAHSGEIQTILSGAWEMIKSIISVALTTIRGVLQTITALMDGDWGAAWQAILETGKLVWQGIQDFFSGALDALKATFVLALDGLAQLFGTSWGAIKNGAVSAWEGIKGAILGIWDGIIQGIKSAINTIIDGINTLIQGMNAVTPGDGIAQIPRFAAGTAFAPGGLALVGERGRELVNLPRGSQVIPNAQTEALLAGGGGGQPVTVNNSYVLPDAETAEMLSRKAADLVYRRLAERGTLA